MVRRILASARGFLVAAIPEVVRKEIERRYGSLEHGDYGKYIRGCTKGARRDERAKGEEDKVTGKRGKEKGHP